MPSKIRFLKKLIVALALLASPSLAFGQSDACETDANAQKYLHAGTFSDTGLGARTWKLIALAQDAKAGDACAKVFYPRALDESHAYWNNIAKKYECLAADGTANDPHPKCNEKRMKAIVDSNHWLRFVETGYPPVPVPGTEAATCPASTCTIF